MSNWKPVKRKIPNVKKIEVNEIPDNSEQSLLTAIKIHMTFRIEHHQIYI